MDRCIRWWCSVKAKEANGISGIIRKGTENKEETQHYATVQLLSPSVPSVLCTPLDLKNHVAKQKNDREKQEAWNDFQKRREAMNCDSSAWRRND